VRSKKDELRTRQKSESGCNGCKATARLSNQEHRKEMQPSQFSLFFNCVIAKLGRIQYQRQITIYETNNTPLSQQYHRWMHSTVNQLRQHADHHTKQGEHARGLRI
jgi:hypothetical protein